MLYVFDCSFLLCMIFVFVCARVWLYCIQWSYEVMVCVLVRGRFERMLETKKNIIMTVSVWARQRCREPGAIGQDLGGGFECVPQRALAHSLEMAACAAILCRRRKVSK